MGLMQALIKNDRAAKLLDNLPERLISKIAFKKALKVFLEAAKKVPAYQEFLRSHNINPEEIKTLRDFEKVPITSKENYIVTNSLHQLVSDKVENYYTYGSSSGATGEALFWSSLRTSDRVFSSVFSRYYVDQWAVDKIPTLLLICLPLGAWSGGIKAATLSLEMARDRKYPVTVIVPGASLEDTKRIVEKFHPYYQQIIIVSLPLFFRNLIDDKNIDWKTLNIKYFGGGEIISEEWRNYVRKQLGESASELNGLISVYASGDVGGRIIGFESIFTNLIRALAKKDKKLARAIFGQEKIPIIVQYAPMSYYLEIVKGKIMVTAESGVPLVRYCIEDRGKILKFTEAVEILKKYQYDYKEVLKGYQWHWKSVSMLPLLIIYGRADRAVIFNGVNIYHPSLEPILYHQSTHRLLHDYKLAIEFDEIQKERLVVHFELKKNAQISDRKRNELENQLAHLVVGQLKKTNLNYADEYRINPKDTHPLVVLHSFGTGPFSQKKLKRKI